LVAYDKLFYQNQHHPGPFFLGNTLSLVEIAIIPFLERFEALLGHYRGYNLFEGGRLPALKEALAAVRVRPAFAKTTATKDYFIAAYAGYAVRS
jgi:glutathione S-transferase